jgi:hypothetical protein
MSTIRRIYVYLLAFAGLAMWSISAALLGQLMVQVVLDQPPGSNPDYVRDTVSKAGAAVLVGLAVWLAHWVWISRMARVDPRERTSTLRRLFLYAVLACAAIFAAVSSESSLAALFSAWGDRPRSAAIFEPLPFLAIAVLVWLAHWRIAAMDRAELGEEGGSATLRRWYLYGGAFVGFVVLLTGTQALLEALWRDVTTPAAVGVALVAEPVATALVGLGLWLVHWKLAPARTGEPAQRDDGHSLLRSVYLFLALAVAVVGTLLGTSQLLYYAVARLLGVDRPGGVGGDILQAAAGPASAALVFGAAWAYQRQAIQDQAAAFEEAPAQAGVRRLYRYLVALIGLAVLATGVAGLLWALCDLVLLGQFAADQVALYATLTLVGLPVWLVHWQPRPDQDAETHSLARRLEIYLSLIISSLILVGSAAALVYRLLGLALGAVSAAEVQVDLAHACAVSAVAAAVAAYHWRVLRTDTRAARPSTSESAGTVHAVVDIRADDAAALDRALDALRATGVEVKVR